MRGRLVLVAAVIAAPGTASAGRTFYGWLYGTEVMPERGAEIQTIVAEQNGQLTPASQDETDWWLEPAIGINDQLELLLPFEISWTAAYDESPRTSLNNFGAELRYRLVTSDLENKPAFVPLVRVAVKRIVVDVHGQYQPEVDLVSSYDVGRVQMLVDLGGVADVGGGQPFHAEFHPGAGVSVLSVGDVRFGAEAFAEISLDNNGDGSWAAVGPNIAWSHGRSWLSAAYGIGIYHIRDAPKLNWGIAF
ncbi:MAG TPA: hypothetical protein VGL61_15930 [Kofleriaceae bacterium]